MNATVSENIFEKYLNENNLQYERDVIVNNKPNGKDIDFLVKTPSGKLLFEIKEVHDSPKITNHINAAEHIRDDIKDLRRKFGKTIPKYPTFLVIMNFTSRPFTSFSVVQAMFGDIGITFNSQGDFSSIHHLYKGNASLLKNKNTSISGVLIFDIDCKNHLLLLNPFVNCAVDKKHFSDLTVLTLKKESIAQDIHLLSSVMFWPHCLTNGSNSSASDLS